MGNIEILKLSDPFNLTEWAKISISIPPEQNDYK
jgi:hypothetical protein